MKKLILTVAMAIIASVSFAGEYDYIKGGSMAYVSTFSDIAAFVQLKAGENVIVWNLNEKTIKLGCGIGTVASGKIDKVGINLFGYTAPTSDLYQVFCYKISGATGNTYLAIIEGDETRSKLVETPLSDEEMTESVFMYITSVLTPEYVLYSRDVTVPFTVTARFSPLLSMISDSDARDLPASAAFSSVPACCPVPERIQIPAGFTGDRH